MSTLVLERVSKRFGGVIAADNVSIDVPPGRITGLIGPNGAGKTTIVNLITGLMELTSGTIRLGDRDLTTTSPHEVSRAGLARTFQNIRLFKEAPVIDNVMGGFHRHETCSLVSSLLALPSARAETRRIREQARALLDRFGMTRYAEFPAGGLAYGHQRRVEMMRALASGPSVLLLDEPVAGMNDVEAGELGAIFRELASGGMAVLLIEHNMRFVTRLCEHVYVLDGGRLIAEGAPKQVTADPAVIAAYLGA
jgi:branched-chain amino acid transport system ATP-binding protein